MTRINTGTNAVVATIKLTDPTLCDGCGQPVALAAADGQVWVGDIPTKTLVRIDPATNAVAQSIPIGIGASDLAIAAGSLWAIDERANQLVRVDPVSGKVIATIKDLPLPAQIAATDDAVWVSTTGIPRYTVSIRPQIRSLPRSTSAASRSHWLRTAEPSGSPRTDPRTWSASILRPTRSGRPFH